MGKEKRYVNLPELKKIPGLMERVLDHYDITSLLTRKGTELIGKCPVHGGKRNSNAFHASTANPLWHCFGDCKTNPLFEKEGWTVISFVMAMEANDGNQIDALTAGRLIEDWTGVRTKRSPDHEGKEANQKPTKEEPMESKKTERPKKENEPRDRQPEGLTNPPLPFALQTLDPDHLYFKERGIRKETVTFFGAGYCKSAKGIMAGRITFPIHNEEGELIAYVGRWPGDPPEGEPRYKLPKGFHKHLVVYNLLRAKLRAEKDPLVIVEGIFGCMWLWQAGFNAVALLGSSLSEEQEELIVNTAGLGGKVILMFDGDPAGRACAEDCLNRLSRKLYVRVIDLADGQQPDSLSEEALRNFLDNPSAEKR